MSKTRKAKPAKKTTSLVKKAKPKKTKLAAPKKTAPKKKTAAAKKTTPKKKKTTVKKAKLNDVLLEIRESLARAQDEAQRKLAAKETLKQHQELERLKQIKAIQETRRIQFQAFNKGKGFSGKMKHFGMRGK